MTDQIENVAVTKIQRLRAKTGEALYFLRVTLPGANADSDKHVAALYMEDEDGLTLLHASEPNSLFSDTERHPRDNSFVM